MNPKSYSKKTHGTKHESQVGRLVVFIVLGLVFFFLNIGFAISLAKGFTVLSGGFNGKSPFSVKEAFGVQVVHQSYQRSEPLQPGVFLPLDVL